MTIDGHLENLNTQGFTVVKSLLDADAVSALHQDIATVFRESIRHLPDDAGTPSDDTLDALYMFLKEAAPGLKSHGYDLLGRLDSVLSTLTSPTLMAIGKTFLESPLILGPSQIRIDDISNDRLLPWHQELEQMSLITLNIWVPLVSIAPGTGGLAVVPGSHKDGLVKHVFTEEFPTYFSLPPEAVAGRDEVSVTMNAGDALVFHPFLFHRSLPNTSGRIRWTIVGRHSGVHTMPYLRSVDAPRVMERNPTPDMPGCDFVRDYLKR